MSMGWHDEFKDDLAKLRPLIGELSDAFWLASILDPERERDIHAATRALSTGILGEGYTKNQILLEPPPEGHAGGDYPLGTVMYAGRPVCSFGLSVDDLVRHLLIVGRSGSGKTNVGYLVVDSLIKSGRPFAVMDWRKNYRHFAGRGADLYILGDPESVSFNPLDPPANLAPHLREGYMRDIVSVIVTTYLPGHGLLSTRGAEYLFLRALDTLGREFDRPVTFRDIRRYVENYKTVSRENEWKATAENVLFKLTTGPVGKLTKPNGITQVPEILQKPVILELDSLGSQTDRAFFTQSFFLWLYYYRLAQGRTKEMRHALIVEEAHNLFLRGPESGSSIHDFTLRQFRDLGESVTLLDQNPSMLTVPALGNTGTTIALNLKHADDLRAAEKALTLDRENWDATGKLPIGSAVVKKQDGWTKPFLVRFPEYPVPEGQKGPSGARKPAEGSYPSETGKVSGNAASARYSGNSATGEIMRDIAEHPLSAVTERYRRLGWTAYSGDKAKRQAIDAGLAIQESVATPAGAVTLLRPTREGTWFLKDLGAEVKPLPHNGGLAHEFHKELVARHFARLGCEVVKEYGIGNGKAVDVVAVKGGRRIAVEVETGTSDIAGNVRKCVGHGFDRVIVAATSAAARMRILQSLGDLPPHVTVTTTRDLLAAQSAGRETGNA